ncbi:AraC family transcriptional regulator ligand-binding domain-containing protein [Variovorax boronicumulans]
MDISSVLESAKIDRELLNAPRARISAAAYSQMWVALADLMDDEFFGLDSHGLRRGSYALMTRAAVNADNLAHALRRILRFLHATLDDFRGELVCDGDEARVVLHDGGVLRRLFGYGTWFILVHGLACWLVHRRIPLREMQFRCPPPGDDSHAQITDRSKDVIISGGENISSVEIEDVIHGHPAVLHAAVVAQPDPKWGEVPCVFIELKAGVAAPTEQEIIAFCRERLAHFKCPRRVIFTPLPKTATGKIQKFRLRQQAGSQDAITRLASHG